MTLRIVSLTSLALVLAAPTVSPQQQAGAPASGRIELSSRSDVAKAEYRAAVEAWVNLWPEAMRDHATKAVAADSGLGLAQIFRAASLAPPVATAEQRTDAISKAYVSISGSPPEMLFALYLREQLLGRTQSALGIIRALAPMVPNDADVAYQLWAHESVGK